MEVKLSIGAFSRMTFVSVKALRHYHEMGLLVPAWVDPDNRGLSRQDRPGQRGAPAGDPRCRNARVPQQLPELWQADLVRLDDDVWLDIQTWRTAVDPARISKAAKGTPILAEMHGLITARLGHDLGERAHTTGTAWAAGR